MQDEEAPEEPVEPPVEPGGLETPPEDLGELPGEPEPIGEPEISEPIPEPEPVETGLDWEGKVDDVVTKFF